MLNPSVADEVVDDPTVTRVIDFSRREGMGAARIVNLFAFITPYPAELVIADDPVGPDTDAHLAEVTRAAGLVIAAWGAPGVLRRNIGKERLRAVRRLLAGAPLVSLGVTKAGQPRHPGRLLASTPLAAWRWPDLTRTGSLP